MFREIDRRKKEINALRLQDGNMCGRIKDYYKIMLTYASNALEGGTLTESETKILLTQGIKTGEKSDWDYYEAVGHARAYDYLYTLDQAVSIGEREIKTLHRLLYSQVDAALGEEQAGHYREERIRLTGSRYNIPAPGQIGPLMADFACWLKENEDVLHPVEFAAKAHKKLLQIYPFMDGNRRVARLLMNLCLIRKGYTITVIAPAERHEYLALLEKAHEDDRPFISFIAGQVAENQKQLIDLANSGQFCAT